MKTWLTLTALALAVPLLVHAAPTQVSPSEWGGEVYNRTDGIRLEANTKAPYIIENGVPAEDAGFGYLESFTPNGIAAVPSALHTIAGLVQSAVAQQLDIGYFGPHRFIFAQSTAQTILPVMDSVGLDISGDQVAAEAYEMFAGILGASGRPAVVGVDPAFYFCLGVKVADVSGASDLHVGWRSATQTQSATITDYLNYATIGLEGTSNPNTIFIMTGNDGSDVSTDTTNTLADGVATTYCVGVGNSGAVAYSIDNAAPTVTAAFTFDDGDSLIPFVQVQQGSDLSGAIDITEWRVGYCREDGKSGPAERVCDATR